MRTKEFRFYSILLKVSGILCIVIGVVLPFATGRRQYYAFGLPSIDWWFPYLAHGITLCFVGITLLIVSVIFSREYRIRKKMRVRAHVNGNK